MGRARGGAVGSAVATRSGTRRSLAAKIPGLRSNRSQAEQISVDDAVERIAPVLMNMRFNEWTGTYAPMSEMTRGSLTPYSRALLIADAIFPRVPHAPHDSDVEALRATRADLIWPVIIDEQATKMLEENTQRNKARTIIYALIGAGLAEGI